MPKDAQTLRRVYSFYKRQPKPVAEAQGEAELLIYQTKYVTTSTAITVDDEYVVVDSSAGPITITLPVVSASDDGLGFIIKDSSGTAAVNNVTINGNGKNIDGAGTYVMSVNYQGVQIIYSKDANTWSAV